MNKAKPTPEPFSFSVEFDGETYQASARPESDGKLRVSVSPFPDKVVKSGPGIERLVARDILEDAKKAGLLK